MRKARVNEPKRPPGGTGAVRRLLLKKAPPILFVVWEGKNYESFRIYKGMVDAVACGHPLIDVMQYHLQTEEDK